MGPLSGLTGLARQQGNIDETPQATPEQRSGNAVDPRHGDWGEQAAPYPWESSLSMGGSHGPYGPENQLLGDPDWVLMPAGDETQDPTFDLTPSNRGGPWPKGILSGPIPGANPSDIADQLDQSRTIHGIRTQAGLKGLYPIQALGVQQDEWVELLETNPGHSDLSTLPRQSMSSSYVFGTTDRTQSFARQNEHGFDSAHMHRRYAAGAIPGNTYWMKPGGRPLAKSLPGPARPAVGVDSPFHGDNLGQAFNVDGAILQNVPAEYSPPPNPTLASASVQPAVTGDDSVVEWY